MPTVQVSNWGDAIFLALTNALNSLLAAIPLIIGALVIIVIGWIIAGIVARIVTAVLGRVGADRLFAQHGAPVYGEQSRKIKPSVIAGELVKWLIRIVFLGAAANVLGLTQVTVLLNDVLLWIPNLIVAAIILLVAPLLARFVRNAIEAGAKGMGFTNGALLGKIAEIAIVAFAVIIAINQIGVAANLVDILFIGVVAALALAFGLAFGLGGREVAGEMLQDWHGQMQATAGRAKAMAPGQKRPATDHSTTTS